MIRIRMCNINLLKLGDSRNATKLNSETNFDLKSRREKITGTLLE